MFTLSDGLVIQKPYERLNISNSPRIGTRRSVMQLALSKGEPDEHPGSTRIQRGALSVLPYP